MPDNPNEPIERAIRQLQNTFAMIKLTPDERNFVERSARALSERAFELLMEVEEPQRIQMRAIIMAVAVSEIIGGPDLPDADNGSHI